MDIIRYTDDFFAMEKELDLFAQQIDGMPWWDPVRHDVFYFIYHRLSGEKLIQASKISILRRGWRLIVRRLMAVKLRVMLLFGRYDALALRAPRLAIKGSKADLILDDILSCAPGRVLVIDTFPHYYHIKLTASRVHFHNTMDFCKLNQAVESRFGQYLDVESLVAQLFVRYRDALVQYGKLLDRVDPKFILLVQNGIEKALFRAAHDRTIPIIEAQHGLINYVHPAYSYPTEISAGSLSTLPTIFLAFSQYWVNQCHYPVDRVVVTGNRQLFVAPVRYGSNDILVVSSDIYEKAIEEVLRPAAIKLWQRHFVYKLHPNQFAYLSEIKDRLSDLPNVEVVSNEQTFRHLIQRCSNVLCIQSTGVYEALQAGLSVCLLARLDYETHLDVFDHPNLRIVHDYKEFIREVSNQSSSKDSSPPPVFFQEFNAKATRECMAAFIE
jgi:hypothetical protein